MCNFVTSFLLSEWRKITMVNIDDRLTRTVAYYVGTRRGYWSPIVLKCSVIQCATMWSKLYSVNWTYRTDPVNGRNTTLSAMTTHRRVRRTYFGVQYNTIQYNTMENLHSKTDKTNCQFNLAHKLKRTEMFKRKMKWEILRIEIVLNVKIPAGVPAGVLSVA